MRLRLMFHKFLNWEYWPVWVVYFPCFFLYIFYAIRLRSSIFFTAANPGMTNGGAFLVPKDEIYNKLPNDVIPHTFLFKEENLIKDVHNWITECKLTFPLIAKPNLGLRGMGLRIIKSRGELDNFLSKVDCEYLVQEFIDYENELGVFFIKNPQSQKVEITSIVEKEFMKVVGDGKSTIKELVEDVPRYLMQIDFISDSVDTCMQHVLKKGEELSFDKIGNHSRGTIFKDGHSRNTPELNAFITSLLDHLPDIYYGRFDMKFSESNGSINYKILELNGAFSEPGHIYDPKYSIFNAWKVQHKHFKYLFNICKQIIKAGYQPMSMLKGFSLIRSHFQISKQFSKMSELTLELN